MKKLVVALCLSLVVVAALSVLVHAQKSKTANNNAVAAITNIENEGVKADLAGDASFYQKHLADDWTGGTSFGTWDTKQSVLQDMKEPSKNKTNSEQMSDLKVRADGNVAVATYKTTYDAIIHGQHQSRTVITTDVFQNQNGTWKEVASHSSQAQQ
jgi:ketosteroid isomerase-like protein